MTEPITRRDILRASAALAVAPVATLAKGAMIPTAEPSSPTPIVPGPAEDLETRAARWAAETYSRYVAESLAQGGTRGPVLFDGFDEATVQKWAGTLRKGCDLYVPVPRYVTAKDLLEGDLPFEAQIEFERTEPIGGIGIIVFVPCGNKARCMQFVDTRYIDTATEMTNRFIDRVLCGSPLPIAPIP